MIYVQDYGAPIRWRLALNRPHAITAITTQNRQGYDGGFVNSFWTTVWDYQREQTVDVPQPDLAATDLVDLARRLHEQFNKYPTKHRRKSLNHPHKPANDADWTGSRARAGRRADHACDRSRRLR